MPIRLVVAITVGAAAMSLLVPMLDGVEQRQETPVTVEPDRQQVVLESNQSTENVTISVVSVDGAPIEDSTVVVSERSLLLPDGPHTFETEPDSHEVTVSVGNTHKADVPVAFRQTQRRGTVELSVRPPSTGGFTTHFEQPELTVSRQS